MRIPDGFLSLQVILLGWIIAIVSILIYTRIFPELSNKEISQLALFTAFQFFLQLIALPIFGIPLAVTITGIPLTILAIGVRKGIMSSITSLLLSSILIPGYFATAGVNISNVIIASLFGVILPQELYRRNKMHRTSRMVITFFSVIIYIILESFLIFVEFTISHQNLSNNFVIFLFVGMGILGIAEAVVSTFILKYLVIVPTEHVKGLQTDFLRFHEREQKKAKVRGIGVGESHKLLDPQSKLIVTSFILLSVAVSTHFEQVFFYAFLLIPLYILYNPNLRFFKRILLTLPLQIALGFLIYLTFGVNSRTLSILIPLRFFTSVAHSSLLLESEDSLYTLLEASVKLGLPRIVGVIIILAYRITTRLLDDYQTLSQTIKSRGYDLTSKYKSQPMRHLQTFIYLYRNLLNRAIIYSDKLPNVLQSRGFDGEFTEMLPPTTYTGKGLIIAVVALGILFAISPYWLSKYSFYF